MTSRWSKHWILEGREPVEVDLRTWAEWFGSADRLIGNTMVTPAIRVSTVFLGIDHNFLDEGPPLIFETMVFGGPSDQFQDRYSTYAEAEKGHWATVRRIAREVGAGSHLDAE